MIRLPGNRIAWLQALTVITLATLLAGTALYVSERHASAEQHLLDLEPRYARLLGMSEQQAKFQAMGQQTGEQLKQLAYPSGVDATQAGNDAQQRIRALFADSKLDIISIQVLPPKEEGPFDRIPIDLRVEGELTGMQNALSLLTAQAPAVLTDEVTMQTIGAVKPASVQRLSGQFSLAVFRVR